MFEPEDFKVPLEKQLRLRVIIDEIEHCTDVKVLQDALKSCTQTLLSYQHILAKITERNLREEIKALTGIIDTSDDL